MLLLVCAVASACSKSGASGPPPGRGYDYLVTPSGRLFRILMMGPVIGGQGKKLGTMIKYAGETPEIAQIKRDAEDLAAAFGPEMELAGETAMMVQVDVGCDRRKMVSECESYTVVFERESGRWARLPPKANEPKALDRIDGPLTPPADPTFSFDQAQTSAAASSAARFVAILDAGDVDASVGAAAEEWRSQLNKAMSDWRRLVVQRGNLAVAGSRVELYRMQTRNGAAAVLYEVRPKQGGRFLERVSLRREQDGWRPVGYAFQALPVTDLRSMQSDESH